MPSEEHNRLTVLGARWLNRNGFAVVATELTCFGSREQPDVIGFRSSCSAIIEVKVSRADFFADSKKPERESGGLGNYRFYLCPEDMIKPEEVPPRWGLLYVKGRSVKSIVKPKGNLWPSLVMQPELALIADEWIAYQHTPDYSAERQALFSIARRLSADSAQV
ncbi:hypothetical protein GCM10009425_39870 [Pseudomonas asuensis]|uniref:Uncharacterized protein n=1 Tax=Pseudomonas asuensis TaxID=1825787 RepID=A0ABQ2H121_9PSED|nr:hypothetical protein [Pseudomonas asuensis]GGM25065.1 hypothetical protein GCM10009425_39870 [Pseudomonas asuensis]